MSEDGDDSLDPAFAYGATPLNDVSRLDLESSDYDPASHRVSLADELEFGRGPRDLGGGADRLGSSLWDELGSVTELGVADELDPRGLDEAHWSGPDDERLVEGPEQSGAWNAGRGRAQDRHHAGARMSLALGRAELEDGPLLDDGEDRALALDGSNLYDELDFGEDVVDDGPADVRSVPAEPDIRALSRATGYSTSQRAKSSRQDMTFASSSSAMTPGSGSRTPTEHDDEVLDVSKVLPFKDLEDSTKETDQFLLGLRQHMSSASDPTLFQAHHRRALSASGPVATDSSDRQPLIEALATSLVKTMYELARQREAQVRDLMDIERAFARNDIERRTALACLDELATLDDDDFGWGPEKSTNRATIHDTAELVDSQSFASIASYGHSQQAPLPSPSPPDASLSLDPVSSTILCELVALRTVTVSLVSGLQTINDLAQVNAAAATDAGRKLRAFRGQIGAHQDDLDTYVRSEAFVEREFAREGSRSDWSGGVGVGSKDDDVRPGQRRTADAMRDHVMAIQERLDDGWRRAQVVLKMVA